MMEESFCHKERRFLVPVNTAEANKIFAITGGHTYEVKTLYLDTPERTWADKRNDKHNPKIRFRTYNGQNSFLERKLHSSGYTNKQRTICNKVPDGFEVLGGTEYTRTEYTIEGTRFTVDRNVRFSSSCLPEVTEYLVVEVKGRLPDSLSFLRTYESKRWSKWRYLSGQFRLLTAGP